VKLPKSIKVKDTVSLFSNKYKYKIVIVCPVASWYRGNDLDNVKEQLAKLNLSTNQPWVKIKSQDDIDFCHALYNTIVKLSDYDLRIEHPLINFYTNNTSDIEVLSKLNPDRIKYISLPNKQNPALTNNTVLVKRLDYDYKVHIGKSRRENSKFVSWAENNDKIRLTGRAKKDLMRSASWGGSYFYVKGEKTLTMVKLFLTSEISKVESVIKA
jgi:hypothetical protein